MTPQHSPAPWSIDRGQLRDRDGNALASVPIYPDGIGGAIDAANGQLLAAAPDLVDALKAIYRLTGALWPWRSWPAGPWSVRALTRLQSFKRYNPMTTNDSPRGSKDDRRLSHSQWSILLSLAETLASARRSGDTRPSAEIAAPYLALLSA